MGMRNCLEITRGTWRTAAAKKSKSTEKNNSIKSCGTHSKAV